MKKSKEKKNWLYRKYVLEHQKEEEVEKISQKIGVKKENVVINRVSTNAKILEIIRDFFAVTLKFVFWVSITLLISLGATVLVNANLRKIVFDVIRNVIN